MYKYIEILKQYFENTKHKVILLKALGQGRTSHTVWKM